MWVAWRVMVGSVSAHDAQKAAGERLVEDNKPSDEEEAGAAFRVDVNRGWRGLRVSALCVHGWQAGWEIFFCWEIYTVMLALASEPKVRGIVPRVSASGAWWARLLDN